MADEKPHDPMSDVWFVVLLLVGLVILWYASGGPSRADLRGILLSPPPPVGTGEAYQPQPQMQSDYEPYDYSPN